MSFLSGVPFVGSLLDNLFASNRQEDAQAFSAQQYATRYQTQVKDLQAAGLNPMLAYAQSPGASPSGAVATPSNNFSQAAVNSAQVANIQADTENKKAQADLIEAQAFQTRSSAWKLNADSELVNMQTKEITNKLENNYYKADTDRMLAVAKELQSQYDLNIQKGKTEEQARGLMLAQATKLYADTDLINLDIKAANALENAGRVGKELKPAFDILRGLLRK